MPQVCIYLQLHQPDRLREVSLFEVGASKPQYFSQGKQDENRTIFRKVAAKSYLPMLGLLLKLVDEEPRFCFALSCSGVFLEQAERYQPEVLRLLQMLAQSGRVEFLTETYYHSLASLYSQAEFERQVRMQYEAVQQLFGVQPKVFRNTELIYSNDVAAQVSTLPFPILGMLTEAVDRYLGRNSKTSVFKSTGTPALQLLLKHAQLSDDVAFRFSDRNWQWYPLTVDRYLEWVQVYGETEVLNLFMDFETFGEHQWKDTGIFDFFTEFVRRFSDKEWNSFTTPQQIFSRISHTQKLPEYNVPEPISWADVDRDLTAWRENAFQQDTLRLIYSVESKVLESKNKQLLEDWRRLQTSDHFYYMCTKWSADGDVHAYFSPYDSPHEAYRRFSIVLADLVGRMY